MSISINSWDYLIITASNDAQAAAYGAQLQTRRELGLLSGVREAMVVPDPGGKRIGSGGSTVLCLMEILNRELPPSRPERADPAAWLAALSRLRVLILHAGGDSRRLPAYGPCGKIFVPVPGHSDSALGATLFDCQLPTYLGLQPPEEGGGQVVVTSGDVLLIFDPSKVRFASSGITGLGCPAAPQQASRHGVFCAESDGTVRRFLQKPTPAQQQATGAVNRYGQSILDIGVMNVDAATAVALLRMCDARSGADGKLTWTGAMGEAILSCGLDFYLEICCALGTRASAEDYRTSVRACGSRLEEPLLNRVFTSLSGTAFAVRVLPRCGFLHFGTTRQMITSGTDLLRADLGVSHLESPLSINNDLAEGGRLVGAHSWVEGCRVRSTLTLAGENLVVGADIDQALSLPRGACLDVVPGRSRGRENDWLVRCYGVNDTFKDSVENGGTFCNLPMSEWLSAVGAGAEDVWDGQLPADRRTLWEARVFPVEASPSGYRRWLWMYDPAKASPAERKAWLEAPRRSPAEMADLADHKAFHQRRSEIRAKEIRDSLRNMFRLDSGFSAADLAWVLARTDDRAMFVADLLAEAHWCFGEEKAAASLESLKFSRVIHTLATALSRLAEGDTARLVELLPGLPDMLKPAVRRWLEGLGLSFAPGATVGDWARRACSAAFEYLGLTIVSSGAARPAHPVSILRGDQIVWGRAPARVDLGGGWSDTPPYSLEHGGCVINAALNLNGQPPIQCYARVIREPLIRIASIDLGARIEVRKLEDLLNYKEATGEFALAKASLALSGFSPASADWPEGTALARMLELFGGGIELTTLAAIPKGSGLGTSSIVGAVILSVVQRLMGRTLTQRDLFHGVLRLEQALTTGGGWQDQVGGVAGGVKLITTAPALVPDARIHYVPGSVLDPKANGGCTLLYYTGITRLAKNILQHVVGRYLDRDRLALATLRRIHELPPHVADAMARKDLPAFGRLMDVAWRLNKQLDPDSGNEQIEALLDRVRPYVHGAKLAGAGGGGFLLMVCRSPGDAAAVRETLESGPPNDRARFFDFAVAEEGLVVTAC